MTEHLECVWPDECQPASKGCARMEELLSERRDGYAEALEWMEDVISSYTDRGDVMRVADALAEINSLRGDLLLPVRTVGINADNMRIATNLSLSKATAGSVIKFLAASPPRWYVVLKELDKATGKTKSVWHSGFQNEDEDEAKAFRDERRVSLRKGHAVRKDRITVEQYLAQWLPLHSQTKSLSPNTVYGDDRQISNSVNPYIGKMKMQDVTTMTISRL